MRNYGKLCTIIYDMDKPYASNEEVELYTKSVNSKQLKILEPMCGSGRFYIPLIKAGYDITGFDSSQDMLDSCIIRCSQLNINPKVFKADITEFKSIEKFNYVFIPFGSISLIIDEKELHKSFINIYDCLAINGEFIFSFMNENMQAENISEWKETKRYPINGKEIVCKQKLNYLDKQKILDIKLLYELIDNGVIVETEHQDFPIKLYSKQFIKQRLLKLNFSEVQELESLGGNTNFTVLKCVRL